MNHPTALFLLAAKQAEIKALQQLSTSCLLVTNQQHKLLGIVSWKDIMRLVVQRQQSRRRQQEEEE